MDKPWKCAGCGAASVATERTCDCPTNCLVRDGSTEYHRTPQRMMTAFDLDKGEMRDFAVDDIDWQNNAELDRALSALKEQDHG